MTKWRLEIWSPKKNSIYLCLLMVDDIIRCTFHFQIYNFFFYCVAYLVIHNPYKAIGSEVVRSQAAKLYGFIEVS